MEVIEILNSDNAVKIALQYPDKIFCFENDWNGEIYNHKYKFKKETCKFEEI